MRDGTGFEMEIVGEDFFSDGVVEVHCCFYQSQLDILVGGKVVIGVSRLFSPLSLSPLTKKMTLSSKKKK